MRLFAGIRLPPEALPPVLTASEELHNRLGVRMAEPENLHLTLKFLGDVDEGTARLVESALSSVRFSPFQVSLSGAGAFPNRHFPRAIWIGGKSEGAERLAASVEGALSFLRLRKEKFAVHLTVARAPKSAADIEDFLQKTGDVCSFGVNSFCLVKSRLLPSGPVHEVIKEYFAERG